MTYRFFVTGTDTEVGKTLVSLTLLHKANTLGLTTAALKPVAAGCYPTPEGLRNEDALALQQTMSADLPYHQVNPVALEAPIAPHIAAANRGQTLDVDTIAQACQPILNAHYQVVIVEGAGGWRVPLNANETMADLAIQLKLPVILVVGLRLGCINHALLSAEAIREDGLPLAGWVANQVQAKMPYAKDNIDTLVDRLEVPFMGYTPYLQKAKPVCAAEYLDIEIILGK